MQSPLKSTRAVAPETILRVRLCHPPREEGFVGLLARGLIVANLPALRIDSL